MHEQYMNDTWYWSNNYMFIINVVIPLYKVILPFVGLANIGCRGIPGVTTHLVPSVEASYPKMNRSTSYSNTLQKNDTQRET